MGFLGGTVVKNLPANAEDARDMGSIPGLGRSPGEGNDGPLQYSCLENPTDRGAWWATVHGVTKRIRHNWVTKQQFKNSLSASCVPQEVLPFVYKTSSVRSSSHPSGPPNSSAPCTHSGGHTDPSLPLNWSGLWPCPSLTWRGQSLQHPHGWRISCCWYLPQYLTTVLVKFNFVPLCAPNALSFHLST